MSTAQIGEGPDRDRVLECFDYDPETGLLTWNRPAGRFGQIPAGTPAGSLNGDGYRFVRIDGVSYPVARLIWLIVHGVWPDHIIDHDNGNKDDNKLSNLRLSDDKQSNVNRKVHKRNKCGFKGVSRTVTAKGTVRYRARIMIGDKPTHIGYFSTEEEAYEAYAAKAKELHGEFYRP